MRLWDEKPGGWHVAAACLAALLCAPIAAAAQGRPQVGVAFGGGSARGLAHVGVIRWLEEHHIPIDVAAGTSIGGLIGGSFATGMNAAELEALLDTLDWNGLFGSFNFQFKNIRRKADARAFPSRLEFGLKRGPAAPTALNNGQQVDRLIDRLAAPYYATTMFDDLPTPFRVVAVDLRTARMVVLDRGSLARAIRATVSYPGLFPPVEMGDQVLVDGGVLNNVPADVVRSMGASAVIAVNVSDVQDLEDVDYSMFGMMAESLDAMIRANSKTAMAAADVVLDVTLVEKFGSFDWQRSRELVTAGYQAAEAMRDKLLPYAIGSAEWDRWIEQRRRLRKTTVPRPAYVAFEGIGRSDERRMAGILSKHIGRDVDMPALERDLDLLVGLERYETIWWQVSENAAGEAGLTIRARPRPYAPPFLMLGFTLENTASDAFKVSASARYLQFDIAGSGSELRLDGTAGSDASLAASLYRPLGRGFFASPHALIADHAFHVIEDERVVATYGRRTIRGGLDLGVNLGRLSDARMGVSVGTVDASVVIGDPGLPEVSGRETLAHAAWRYDSQDSPVVPGRGIRAVTSLRHTLDGPEGEPAGEGSRGSTRLTQLDGEASQFWTVKDRNRIFVLGGAGTSFNRRPLRYDQYSLGSPLHLGGFGVGELFGDHYVVATTGYLREFDQFPSFLGGRVFVGGWIENGSAFDDWDTARWHTQLSVGVMADTVLGPVMVGTSAGAGRWRTYVSIGPIF